MGDIVRIELALENGKLEEFKKQRAANMTDWSTQSTQQIEPAVEVPQPIVVGKNDMIFDYSLQCILHEVICPINTA
jgi:hypothetical protein